MNPYVIENAIDLETFSELWLDNLDPYNQGWTLSNRSYKSGPPSWTRRRDLFKDNIIKRVSDQLKDNIEETTNTKLSLERINVNGQTSGQISEIHNDYPDPTHITTILFCCPNWNAQWGGSFTVYNPETKSYLVYPYIPNQAVVIPSEWDHYGESPNHFTHEMRVTIAFMFEKILCGESGQNH